MKILIATGGSKHSDDAVRTGAQLARATNTRFTILTVVKDPGRRVEAQAIIHQAVALAKHVDVNLNNLHTLVRLGHPAEEIVSEATEGRYGLIVMGTWPSHNLLHRLLAPTTERVVMLAPCPVMVAKGKMGPIRHVLLCISGAESPSKAARFLREMVSIMTDKLNITVLHVMSQISGSSETADGWQLKATAEQLMREKTPEGEWLQRETEILNRAGAQVQPKVRHGLVVEELLAEASEGEYDLLLIGAHRISGWQRYLLDDLTHQIVVRSDRPVLIV